MASAWVDPDVAADPRQRALTLRLALSQQTGFPNWRSETGGVLRFQSSPGMAYGYSGEGYEYARRFVERKLGVSIEPLARRYVFYPFGMTDASFTKPTGFAGRVAWPLGPDGKYAAPTFSETGNAADMLCATIGDYARFVAGVMSRHGLPDHFARQRDSIHVLDPGARAMCNARVATRCPDVAGYGLGWAIMKYAASRTDPAESVVWHTGSDVGARAIAFYFPERHEGAVMFANGANGFDVMIDVGTALFRETAFAGYLQSGRH